MARSYEEIVDWYLTDHAMDEERELEWFISQPTLADAVRRAGLAERPFGKRFDHQRRIRRGVLPECAERLSAELQRIKRVQSFHELLELVEDTIGNIKWAGEVLVYDASLRIGAKLKLSPENVYLHAGTREGARYMGFKGTRRFLELHELPPAFQSLRPDQLEDVLCIYKMHLKALASKQHQRFETRVGTRVSNRSMMTRCAPQESSRVSRTASCR
jgi:hypothetical protein